MNLHKALWKKIMVGFVIYLITLLKAVEKNMGNQILNKLS